MPGLALVSLFSYGLSRCLLLKLAFQEDKHLLTLGGMTSLRVPRTLCSLPLEVELGCHAVKWPNSCVFFFVLFWQNQLLAKGLLFVEEKIKLCEGKYEAALTEWGPCDSAFDVWAAEVLLS